MLEDTFRSEEIGMKMFLELSLSICVLYFQEWVFIKKATRNRNLKLHADIIDVVIYSSKIIIHVCLFTTKWWMFKHNNLKYINILLSNRKFFKTVKKLEI